MKPLKDYKAGDSVVINGSLLPLTLIRPLYDTETIPGSDGNPVEARNPFGTKWWATTGEGSDILVCLDNAE